MQFLTELWFSVIRDIYQILGENEHGQASQMFTMMDKVSQHFLVRLMRVTLMRRTAMGRSLSRSSSAPRLRTRTWSGCSPSAHDCQDDPHPG